MLLKSTHAVEKSAAFKSLGEESCEINGRGHEMAAMMVPEQSKGTTTEPEGY